MGMRVADDNLPEADFGYTLSPKKIRIPGESRDPLFNGSVAG